MTLGVIFIKVRKVFYIMKEHDLSEQSPQSEAGVMLLGLNKPISKLTEKEAKQYLDLALRLISWLPQEEQFLISKIGEQLAVVTTNEGVIYGDFMGFESEIKGFKVQTLQQVYDFRYGKNYLESATSIIKKAYITNYKWLVNREEKIDQPITPQPKQNEIIE